MTEPIKTSKESYKLDIMEGFYKVAMDRAEKAESELAKLIEVAEAMEEALEDIRVHSKSPFDISPHWRNYIHEVAEEALSRWKLFQNGEQQKL